MSSTSLKTPLSMLDLATVREGKSVADALQTSVKTAQHAESLGFNRYWLASSIYQRILGLLRGQLGKLPPRSIII